MSGNATNRDLRCKAEPHEHVPGKLYSPELLQRTRIFFEVASKKLFVHDWGIVEDSDKVFPAGPEIQQFAALISETKLSIHDNSIPKFLLEMKGTPEVHKSN